jgi:prepilin-type N-terminal cleavage/methylation domain-containing protein
MPTSADRAPHRGLLRGQAGFTLLEIMVVVGIVGLCILPILTVKGQSTARAYKAKMMRTAMDHAERLLVDCMRTEEEYDRYESTIEQDSTFTYVLTLEEFDVSTGLTAEEAEDVEAEEDDGQSLFGGSTPGDAGVGNPDEDDEERDNPHLVRRFRIRVLWPSWDGEDDEADDYVDLEGYLPRVFDREEEEDDEA